MTNSKFTMLLRQCRINSGLTQKQVATALNVERSTYAYYETGETRPSCEFVLKVSKIFNVDYRIFMDAIADTKIINVDDEEEDEAGPALARMEDIYKLSQKEQNLVLTYRVLPPERQKEISEIVIPNLSDGKKKKVK